MELSADIIVSNIIGAAVALLIAFGYHIWARRDARQDFTVLTRFLESFSRALLEGNDVQVGFTRDAKDRVRNVSVSVHVRPVGVSSVAKAGSVEVETQNGENADEGET